MLGLEPALGFEVDSSWTAGENRDYGEGFRTTVFRSSLEIMR
jgi:hypothetical protein